MLLSYRSAKVFSLENFPLYGKRRLAIYGLNIVPNVDGIIFRWRLVIAIWYLVPHATVITKRHYAIRHQSEFLMLKVPSEVEIILSWRLNYSKYGIS